MSTTVDSRVVEMRFDNKQFESNVSTTMSTLDKLKAKLDFKGTAKGFDEMGNAVKNVKMDRLGSSVDAVQAKFSAMQVVGVTALANITNSAVNAGKRMLSALTIDPVKTGFSEYELKMDSIKTIMASTGESVETVNKYLNELNEYSDQTIYSFADMTQNIGKFTNAGVKLEDAVLAIKGISNEAAVSGANANEASRAMYNFAQALSAGYVKLIDWKSIENANMATVEFKQQLIDSAVAAGTLTKTSDGMYKTLTGKTLNATQNFNDTLQEQWMTSEVLIETLKNYADENTAIGKKAKAAAQDVTKLTQVFDILKETAQSGWARTWELIIGDINQAKALLTPLTNFLSGIIDGISDARNRVLQIALDFAAPWKAIAEKLGNVKKVIGEVGKAIKPLEYFQEVVNKVWRGDYNNRGDNPDRYDLLKAAGYDHRVVQELVNKGYQYKLTVEDVQAAHEKFGLTMETTTEETEEVVNALDNLTDEQLKNAGLTEDEIRLYRALQKEAKRLGISVNELADEMTETSGRDLLVESFKNIGSTLVGIGKAIKEAWVDIFNPPSLEEMGIRLYGLIRSFRDFTATLRLTDPETGKLNENGQKLMRTFKGIFAAIDIVLTIVGGPLRLVFKIITQLLDAFGFNILDVTAWIGDVIVKFRDWIDKTLDFTKVFEKIVPYVKKATEAIRNWFASLKERGVFEKIGNSIKNVIGVIGEWFTMLKDSGVFEKIGNAIKKVVGTIGSWIKAIKESGIITKVFTKIVTPIKNAVTAFRNWIELLKKSDNIPRDIAAGIASGFGKAFTAVANFAKKIPGALAKAFEFLKDSPIGAFVKKLWGGVKSVGQVFAELGKIILGKINGFLSARGFKTISMDSIAGLVNGFKEGGSKVWNAAVNLVKTLVERVKGFLGIHSPSTVFFAIGGFLIAGLIAGLMNGMPDSLGAVKDVFTPMIEWIKAIPWAKIFTIGVIAGALWLFKQLGDFFGGAGKMMKGVGDLLTDVGNGVSKVLKSTSKVISAFGNFVNAAALKMVVQSILILVGAVLLLTLIPEEKLDPAITALLKLAGIVAGLLVVIGIAGKLAGGDKALAGMGGTLFSLSVLLLTMVLFIKLCAGLESDGIENAIEIFKMLGIFLGALLVVSGLVSIFKGSASLDGLTKFLSKLGGALLMMTLCVFILGKIDKKALNRALGAIELFGKVIGALLVISLIGGKRIEAATKTIGAIGLTLLALAVVCKIMGGLTPNEMIKAGIALVAFGVLVGVLLGLTAKFGNAKELKSAGLLIAGVGVCILAMAAACKILSSIEFWPMMQGILGVALLAGIAIALIAATKLAGGSKNMDKAAKLIISLAGAIAVLALVTAAIGLLDGDALKKGLVTVGLLTVFMAILLGVTGALAKNGKRVKNVQGILIGLAAVIGAMGLVLVALAIMDHHDVLLGPVIALGALMVALMVLLKQVAKIPDAKSVMGILIGLAAVIAVLGTTLILLSTLSDHWYSSLVAAGAIAIVLLALAGSFALISKFGNMQQTLGILIVMAVIIAALGATLVLLSQAPWQQSLAAAGAMSLVLLALAASFILISKFGNIQQTLGILITMAVIIGVLGATLVLLSQSPWQQSLAAAGAMSLVLLALAGSIAILSNIKSISPQIIATLLILAVAVGIIGVVMSHLGGMGGSAVITSLIALAGGLAVLVIALNLMNGTLAGAAALVVASAAIIILSQAMLALGSISWGSILAALVALAGVFVILGVAGLVLGPLAPLIMALAAAITLLGVGLLAMGAGMALAAISLPGLATGFMALAQSLAASVPLIIAAIGSMITGIIGLIPLICQGIVVLVTNIANTIVTLIPVVVTAGVNMILGFVNGITQQLPRIIQAAFNLVIGFINGLANGIRNNTGKVLSAVANLISAILGSLGTIFGKVLKIGADIVGKLVSGIASMVGKAVTAAGNLVTKLWNALKGGVSKFTSVGKDLVNGLVNGIKNIVPKAIQAVKNLGSSVLKAICKVLGINSPSKEFAEIGDFAGQGFIEGLVGKIGDVEGAAEDLGLDALDSFSSVFEDNKGSIQLGNLFDPNVDTPQYNEDDIIEHVEVEKLAADDYTGMQQALVDMGYNLGDYGPNGDGVDGQFMEASKSAAEEFMRDMGYTAEEFNWGMENAMDMFLTMLQKYQDKQANNHTAEEWYDHNLAVRAQEQQRDTLRDELLEKMATYIYGTDDLTHLTKDELNNLMNLAEANIDAYMRTGSEVNQDTFLELVAAMYKRAGQSGIDFGSEQMADMIESFTNTIAKNVLISGEEQHHRNDGISYLDDYINVFMELFGSNDSAYFAAYLNRFTGDDYKPGTNTIDSHNIERFADMSTLTPIKEDEEYSIHAGDNEDVEVKLPNELSVDTLNANTLNARTLPPEVATTINETVSHVGEVIDQMPDVVTDFANSGVGKFFGAIGSWIDDPFLSENKENSSYDLKPNRISRDNLSFEGKPNVTPVMDLGEVETGIEAIKTMLELERLSLGSDTSAVDNIVPPDNGESEFAELKSEFAKLRSDIAKMKTSIYNIDGVTYDDGSAVADAVKTIVRAARIERRV